MLFRSVSQSRYSTNNVDKSTCGTEGFNNESNFNFFTISTNIVQLPTNPLLMNEAHNRYNCLKGLDTSTLDSLVKELYSSSSSWSDFERDFIIPHLFTNSQPAPEPVSQVSSEPSPESVTQPSQPVTQPVPQPSQPVPQPSQPVTQPVPQPSQPVTQPVPQPSSQPSPQPSNQKIIKSGNKTIINTTEIKNNDYPDVNKYISELQTIIKDLLTIQKPASTPPINVVVNNNNSTESSTNPEQTQISQSNPSQSQVTQSNPELSQTSQSKDCISSQIPAPPSPPVQPPPPSPSPPVQPPSPPPSLSPQPVPTIQCDFSFFTDSQNLARLGSKNSFEQRDTIEDSLKPLIHTSVETYLCLIKLDKNTLNSLVKTIDTDTVIPSGIEPWDYYENNFILNNIWFYVSQELSKKLVPNDNLYLYRTISLLQSLSIGNNVNNTIYKRYNDLINNTNESLRNFMTRTLRVLS